MHLRIHASLLAAITALLSISASSTAAQEAHATAAGESSEPTRAPAWMLLPTVAGELPGWIEPTAAEVNGVLRQEAQALDTATLRTRLEESISAPPSHLTNLQLDAWMSHSRGAIVHLSSMEYPQARQELMETEEVAQRSVSVLNREDRRAHAVLESCLYVVRLLVETNQFARAEEQARVCRMRVPGVQANALEQTPEVNEVLHHVDEAMRHEPNGHLRVESEPAGCTVRVNGIVFGETPFTSDELARGEYELQVECDAETRGRVHHVRLGEEEVVVRVDPRFEGVLHTRPYPFLRYEDANASREHRVLDALRLAHGAGSLQILLFVPVDGGVRVDRLDVSTQTVVASISLPVNRGATPPIPAAMVTPAVRALVAGRSMDFTTSPARSAEPWRGPHSEPPVPLVDSGDGATDPRRTFPRRPHAGLGWVMTAVGGAALGAGFVLELSSRSLGRRYRDSQPEDVDFLTRQSDWKTSRVITLATAGVGALSASLGLGLALPERDHVPWGAWVTGVVGLGLVAGGAIVGTGGTSCGDVATDRAECVAHGRDVDLATLLGLTGAPLLAVPITYLLMPHSDVSAHVEASPGRAFLELAGRF